jgi:hypothetical protein
MKNQNEDIAKLPISVTPVKTGGQDVLKRPDSRFRGNEVEGLLRVFHSDSAFQSIQWILAL